MIDKQKQVVAEISYLNLLKIKETIFHKEIKRLKEEGYKDEREIFWRILLIFTHERTSHPVLSSPII